MSGNGKGLLQNRPGTANLGNISRNFETTPLHEACADGNVEEARRLLESGTDVDSRDSSESTPLYLVTVLWSTRQVAIPPELFVLLVDEFNADINAGNNRGHTPLHIAAAPRTEEGGERETEVSDVQFVTFLLEAGADVSRKDKEGNTPLDFAKGKKGNDEIVAILEGRPASPSAPFSGSSNNNNNNRGSLLGKRKRSRRNRSNKPIQRKRNTRRR
jgi:ankyrin repeat protein